MLNIHVQIIGQQHLFRFGKNLQQLPRREPMFDIVREPRLQPTVRVSAQGAATINEAFINPRHLRHMNVIRSERAIGQQKANVRCRVLRENVFELL